MNPEKPKPLEEVDPELAELVREYVIQQAAKKNNIGRNDPCPCRSGKKFKKCHGG